jgi:hypothetical protein
VSVALRVVPRDDLASDGSPGLQTSSRLGEYASVPSRQDEAYTVSATQEPTATEGVTSILLLPPISPVDAVRAVTAALPSGAIIDSVDVRVSTAGAFVNHRGAYIDWEFAGFGGPQATVWVLSFFSDNGITASDARIGLPADNPSTALNDGFFVIYVADHAWEFYRGGFMVGSAFDQWRLSLATP